MTYHITEEAQSSLKDGIETVVIPVHDPHDMENLVFHTQRGGVYDVVEWLLSELGRCTELERVCGLSVTPNQNVVTINLEMRQPGKQLEECLLNTRVGSRMFVDLNDNGSFDIGDQSSDNELPILLGILSKRAMNREKFTDKHHPWWENEGYTINDLENEANASGLTPS